MHEIDLGSPRLASPPDLRGLGASEGETAAVLEILDELAR